MSRITTLATFLWFSASSAGTLHGVVRSESGPVPWATVILECAEAETTLAILADSLGRWAMDAPPGNAVLVVRALSYEKWKRDVSVRTTSHTDYDIRLSPETDFNGIPLTSRKDHRRVVWGVTAGSPQLLALTLETHQDRPLRLQATVSTLILASSLTGRVLVTRTAGSARPYAFAGGGLLNVSEGDGGGARGTTGFLWTGVGLAVPVQSTRLFGEIGIVGGLDTDKRFESPLGSVAVGLLVAR